MARRSRLLLHEALHDEVLERVVADTVAIKLGIPDDPATEMGCMVSHAHRDRVLSMIDDARQDGARLLAGGGRPENRPDLDAGAFVEPTVFDGVDPSARLFREEVFGPVLGVTTWTDEQEALRLANDTEYGLTASIWCNDIDRAPERGSHDRCGLHLGQRRRGALPRRPVRRLEAVRARPRARPRRRHPEPHAVQVDQRRAQRAASLTATPAALALLRTPW